MDIHLIGGALYSYWPVDYSKPIDKPGDWARSVAGVREVAKVAEDCGVDYCLEVLNRFENHMLNTAEEAVSFVEEVGSPSVKVMLDTFHMNIEEDSIGGAIRKAGARLGHLHTGECNRKVPGKGRIPWAEVGGALRDIGYQGSVVMEPFVTMGGKVGSDIRYGTTSASARTKASWTATRGTPSCSPATCWEPESRGRRRSKGAIDMRIVLSVDIGTSKVAAVAFDCLAGKSIAAASRPNATDVMGLPPGLHEQDPRAVYELCLELLGGLLGYGKFAPAEVAAIAFSGQMHGVLLASRDLEPLTKLMTWRDRRASGLVSSIDRATWPVGRTGCYLHPGYGGATLAALAMEGLIPTGTVALDMADFVAAKLTGIAAADPTMAASWGIMDLRRGEWDEELLSRLRIPREALPPIVTGSRPLGRLVVDLGLPLGVPVYPPVGDNQASYIGAAGLEGRLLLLNLGTGGQISIPSAVFEFRHEFETRPLPTGGYLMVGLASAAAGPTPSSRNSFVRPCANSPEWNSPTRTCTGS